jgi:hypothetical protein
MNIGKAMSEPLRRIVDHHNAFNRRVKLLFGSLNKVMSDGLGKNVAVTLSYGEEPWGEPKQWSSSSDGHAAAQLLAELGIIRAASAFEDFLQGVIAELDRAAIPAASANMDLVERIIVRLSFEAAERPSLELVRFFDCARNCIVHQMGRANVELVNLSTANGFVQALTIATPRAKAKWKPSVPAISLGKPVLWKPRHAILASDAYYKVAVAIDQRLVTVLGDGGFIAMATHWAVAATIPAVPVKRSLVATLAFALNGRYRLKVKVTEIAPLLKSAGKWEQAKSIFQKRYPGRPLH